MVRALVKEYAPLSASSIKLGMGASAMASGRNPSKLMMSTRSISAFDGVGIIVGVKVGLAVGMGVWVNVGAAVNVTVASTKGVVTTA